jgi:hypothetical protein
MPANAPKHTLRRLTATHKAIAGLLLIGTATGVTTALTATAGAATVTPIAADSFDRANAANWGTANTGGTYSYLTQKDTFTIANNKGIVKNLKPGKTAEAVLNGVNAADVLVRNTITVPSAGTVNLYHSLEARRQADGSNYQTRLHIQGSKVTLNGSRLNGTKATRLGTVTLPITAKAGQNIVVELQVTGTTTVTIMARAYLAGSIAPAWQYTTTDKTSSRITKAGAVGMADYASSKSSTLTITHDDFGAYNPNTPTPATPVVSAPAVTPTPVVSAPAVTPAPVVSAPAVTPAVTPATNTPAPAVTPTAPAVKPAAAITGTVLRNATFENQPLGQVVPTNFINELGSTTKSVGAYDDLSIINDDRGGKAIRTILRANTYKQSGKGDNGNNLFVNLPANTYDNACISYDIRFDAKFGWSYGGKLPGLEGVAPGVSPGTPSGGNSTTLGWSGRMMWVGPGAYKWAGPTNMAVSYMYHPGQADKYGDNVKWNKAFIAGTWHTVKQCYIMNTPGKADGVLQTWMDGTQIINNTNYTYRTRGDVHISHLMFTIFRGGHDANWASDHDGFVDIDNMIITTN